MCFESIITKINSYKKFDQELAISFFKQKKNDSSEAKSLRFKLFNIF